MSALPEKTSSDAPDGRLGVPRELVARPRSVAETGLSRQLLEELVVKHIYEGGVMDLRQLSQRTRLAGPILEELMQSLRASAYVEVRGVIEGSANTLRFALTEKGRLFALDALARSGYIGVAPVALEQYSKLLMAQSVHAHRITHEFMSRTFEKVVIRPALLDQLGAALNSARAIFVYGHAGTGKTYIARRLAWALSSDVLIPGAIAVGESIVEVFDPIIHRPLTGASGELGPMFDLGYDPRFTLCERPAVVTGGELTLDMLEIRHETATHRQIAPIQLKAANGIFVIDDLGRQRVAPVDLFNRWIVPLENREDYLTLANGKRFPLPFDVILVFSTNLDPEDLADDAFLRRIGHKISFGPVTQDEFTAIWQQVCTEQGIAFDYVVLEYVFEKLYAGSGKPMLACHPRDLIGLALDQARYQDAQVPLTPASVEEAWNIYFVVRASSGPQRGQSVFGNR